MTKAAFLKSCPVHEGVEEIGLKDGQWLKSLKFCLQSCTLCDGADAQYSRQVVLEGNKILSKYLDDILLNQDVEYSNSRFKIYTA